MSAADSYRPAPLTPEQKAANEQAVREAVAIVAASYLAETAGRRLNRRLRDQQDRAARIAAVWSRPTIRSEVADERDRLLRQERLEPHAASQ